MAKTLRELARSLSDSERRELMQRIKQSLSTNSSEGLKVYSAEVSQDERRDLIQKEYETLDMWTRFVFWIRKVFFNTSLEEAIYQRSLNKMRQKLMGHNFSMLTEDGLSISKNASERILGFHDELNRALPLFSHYWSEPYALGELVQNLVPLYLADSKNSLFDFITLHECQDLLFNEKGIEDIRKELLNRLQEYMGEIHHQALDQIAELLVGLYHFRELAQFPWAPLERKLKNEVGGDGVGPVKLVYITSDLEALYFAVYMAMGSPPLEQWSPMIFENFTNQRSNQNLEVPGGSEFSDGNPDQGARFWRDSVEHVMNSISSFIQDLPLDMLIRLSKGDPYYRFQGYVGSLQVREFYYATMKLQLLVELDELLPHIKKTLVKELTKEILGGDPPASPYQRNPIGATRFGLPPFRFEHSLRIMKAFLRSLTDGTMAEKLKVLDRVARTQKGDFHSRFSVYTSTLGQSLARFELFEQPYGDDGDQTKTLARLRKGLDHDPSVQRSYRVLTMTADKELQELLQEGSENIRVLSDLSDEIYGTLQGGGEGSNPLLDQLQAICTKFKRFRHLIRLSMDLEQAGAIE